MHSEFKYSCSYTILPDVNTEWEHKLETQSHKFTSAAAPKLERERKKKPYSQFQQQAIFQLHVNASGRQTIRGHAWWSLQKMTIWCALTYKCPFVHAFLWRRQSCARPMVTERKGITKDMTSAGQNDPKPAELGSVLTQIGWRFLLRFKIKVKGQPSVRV